MALPVELAITVGDAKGEKSTFGIYLPDVTTVEGAQTFWESIDNDVYAMIDGEVLSVSVSFPIDLDPLLAALNIADAASDVQEKGYFAFKTAEGFVKSFAIPTFLDTMFDVGSKLINLSQTNVATFITSILASGVSSHNEDLTALEMAREAWGKYRP